MDKILDLIRDRKWDMLLILGLLLTISIVSPFAIKWAVSTAIIETLSPIEESIDALEESVECLEDMQIAEIIDRGIAGYKKVQTIEQLESSTQNAASIKIALRTPEARIILFAIDRERTLLFEEYFQSE